MNDLIDRLAVLRGLPVLIGVALVILNFVVQLVVHALGPATQPPGLWLFLIADGNLLLHLGVITGLVGVLVGDIL
jgi:hypothetical protein